MPGEVLCPHPLAPSPSRKLTSIRAWNGLGRGRKSVLRVRERYSLTHSQDKRLIWPGTRQYNEGKEVEGSL